MLSRKDGHDTQGPPNLAPGTHHAAYSFNEVSGTTLTDSAGPHDGTIEGATWTAEGKFGSALSFDGEDDLVSIADANDLDLTGSFTLQAWVKPSEDFSTNRGVGTSKFAFGPKALPAGEWTHLALTSDTKTLRPALRLEELGVPVRGNPVSPPAGSGRRGALARHIG